eukprot:12070103-Alexandrium_andersonii.AAC.1
MGVGSLRGLRLITRAPTARTEQGLFLGTAGIPVTNQACVAAGTGVWPVLKRIICFVWVLPACLTIAK